MLLRLYFPPPPALCGVTWWSSTGSPLCRDSPHTEHKCLHLLYAAALNFAIVSPLVLLLKYSSSFDRYGFLHRANGLSCIMGISARLRILLVLLRPQFHFLVSVEIMYLSNIPLTDPFLLDTHLVIFQNIQ